MCLNIGQLQQFRWKNNPPNDAELGFESSRSWRRIKNGGKSKF